METKRQSKTLYRLDESGRVSLCLHQGQSDAWRSDARFTAMIAGTQGGKTSFGPWWLYREIQRLGAGDYLAVTANYKLYKLKFLPALREVLEYVLGCGRYWSSANVIELADPETGFWAKRADDPMWARVILLSSVAKGGLESATALAALLDEGGQDEFTLDAWLAILRRLSLSRGRALITTTPYNTGWLKRDFYDRWIAGDPDYRVIQFASDVNPVFPAEEMLRAERTMSAHQYRMFYLGEWATPPGLVYDCFDETYNLVQPHAPPPSAPHFVGVDFGGANTAKCYAYEDTKTGVLTVYRCDLTGGMSTAEHCADARRVLDGHNLVGSWGGSPSETQQRLDWIQSGLPVQPPGVADVESGIERVYAMIKTRRLKIASDQRGLLDEIGSYKRVLDANGQPTDEIADKRTYHRLDALRYLIVGHSQHSVQYGQSLWG